MEIQKNEIIKEIFPTTLRDVFNGKVDDKICLNVLKYKINLDGNKNISGIIKGKKEDRDGRFDLRNSQNNNDKKALLKRSERLNFIEYGSTLGYVRPNIKKGIDFIHKPRVDFEKYDSNSSMNIFNRPFVVNDRIIGSHNN